MGVVYFDKNVVIRNNEETPIERTENNDRQRPNAHNRHSESSIMESTLKIVDQRDFEWMAWNYRTYKSSTKFESK